ncbi:hypothetical protein [Streptomyces sp. NPDC050585]|uniref:LexA family protein n=1 Tax=Streptomyces sp. NPDC050585 TaxID=3365632 RepID=UPI0037A3353F
MAPLQAARDAAPRGRRAAARRRVGPSWGLHRSPWTQKTAPHSGPGAVFWAAGGKRPVARQGCPLSMREIDQAVKLKSTSSVAHPLTALERKGFLCRDSPAPRRPRAASLEQRLPHRHHRRAGHGSRPPRRLAAGPPIRFPLWEASFKESGQVVGRTRPTTEATARGWTTRRGRGGSGRWRSRRW